jgi:hypothetical protein
MATNSPEAQAKHDVQDLNKKGADHNVGLQNVVDHAHSMQMKDLKSEQSYWNTVAKSAHGSLPELTIHKNAEGNVDSVKQGDKSLYNRDDEVKRTIDNFTGALKKGQGPFQAFKDAGLTDQEASKNAKAVMEVSGRSSFHAGEKLGVHSDGSVTSTTTGHDGKTTTEERYNKNKTHETKVTHPNGDFDTTYKKADGSVDHTLEHKTLNGTTFESKKNPDGKVTETSQLTADGTLTTSKMNAAGDKPIETTVTKGNDSTTTKFQENGNTAERTTVKDGVSTTTKFQADGATPAEKSVTQDGKTLTTKYAPNGIDRTETVEKGADGLSTTTKFDATTKQKTSEHKEKANGYVDTEYKNGKEVQKTDRTNGPNDSYSEIHTTARTPQGDDARTSTRERGETGADGKFHYKEKNTGGGRTDTYDMTFEKDGKTAVGTRTIQGSGRNNTPHTYNEYYYNNSYSEKPPKPAS